MPKSHKEQILNKCRHFNGLMNDVCKAGVAYADVRGGLDKYRLPCLKDQSEGTSCEKCSYFTEPEADARVAETAKRFNRTMEAREAIVAHLGPFVKGVSGSGAIDCPVCAGNKSLRFSRAGVNGHIHASCTTADCVAWME